MVLHRLFLCRMSFVLALPLCRIGMRNQVVINKRQDVQTPAFLQPIFHLAVSRMALFRKLAVVFSGILSTSYYFLSLCITIIIFSSGNEFLKYRTASVEHLLNRGHHAILVKRCHHIGALLGRMAAFDFLTNMPINQNFRI